MNEKEKELEIEEVESTGEKNSKVKQIQKNFKFTSETERDELADILTVIKKPGQTDGTAILETLKSVLSEGERAEVIANANQTLAKVYEASFMEVELMQRRLVEKYTLLMSVANLEVDKVRNELTEHFEKKVSKLEKANERLESELSRVKFEKEELGSSIDSKDHLVTEVNTRIEDLTKTLETKDLSIVALTNQLAAKDDLVEEFKSKANSLNETIAQLTTDQQSNLTEMKELRAENKQLNESYLKSNEVIIKLTNDLEKTNIELEHSKKDMSRFESELSKIETRYEAQLEQLRKELDAERQSKSDLQSELMKLMTALTTQTKEVKEDVKEETPTPKAQREVKKPYTVKNEKGEVVFSGNKNGLVKYVNKEFQPKVEVTKFTDNDDIRELIHPNTLEAVME